MMTENVAGGLFQHPGIDAHKARIVSIRWTPNEPKAKSYVRRSVQCILQDISVSRYAVAFHVTGGCIAAGGRYLCEEC